MVFRAMELEKIPKGVGPREVQKLGYGKKEQADEMKKERPVMQKEKSGEYGGLGI